MTPFQMRPTVPSPETRADLMAQARAMLTPPLDPTAETQPEYADCELCADDDLTIEVGDRVSVFPAGAWEPRNATVKAVRGDGQYLVHMSFGVTKWVWERDIILLVKASALEISKDGVA